MSPLLTHAYRQDGRALATRHVLTASSSLSERDVRRRLRQVDREFAAFFRRSREEAPPGENQFLAGGRREWLLENDFIVADAVGALDGTLSSEFLDRLPGLRSVGPDEADGAPRVEVLARELVRRDRGRVDADEVSLFVEGYQEIHALRLAELWALPSFLRLILLEDLLAGVKNGDETLEVGPYIIALRSLAAQDWREVVESLSRVEAILRRDPANVYARMDFRTRDRYRGEVENISRVAGREEEAVAREALELARSREHEAREGHVGYYLVDEGRAALYEAAGSRVPHTAVPSRRRRIAAVGYFGAIGLLAVLAILLVWKISGGGPSAFVPVLFALIPAVGVAVALANRLAGQFVPPHALSRLDMRGGIPDPYRTLVAVPVLLGSRREVRELLDTLESNHQANSDPNLTFALVSDYPDADSERIPEDDAVLATAAAGIRRLNERYGRDGHEPFMLLHRSRRWNPVAGRWMGWERKRGKLIELNRLIMGHPSSLHVVIGRVERVRGIAFVLTLDSDTRLPQNAAARLVGTLAHPLNRPEVGPGGRILRGYSVLQPRLEPLPEADGGTIFSRVYGGVQGLDLYSRAAFDVYQDLFDVGIFAGKGIYDVRAFEASLAGRAPDDAILSHDLFEGAHGRAGLVSDLILLEEFPGHPLTYARRAHRWIRGDWQLLPWLFPRVAGAENRRVRNRIPALGRWMIADNLRRSAQPLSILLALVSGWFLLPPEAVTLWTLLFAVIVGQPFLTGTVDAALRGASRVPRRADLEVELRALMRALGKWSMDLAFLPFEARNAGDAIVRTLHRVFRSRKMLLEWTSAAVTARTVHRTVTLGVLYRQMWSGPVLALGAGGVLAVLPGPFPIATLPLLALWLMSPAIGQLVRKNRRPIREPRGEFPTARARTLARRTWGYYERFVGPEGHWMAPDHFQEDPGGQVDRRTSPTNLGMGLVAVITAWDLGFVGTSRFITHVRSTVEGMKQLPRYRGHFFNWYDTRTLQALHPLYVSTVDSGNLAAGLLSTREALSDARIRPVWTPGTPDGLIDTVRVVGEIIAAEPTDPGMEALLRQCRQLEAWCEQQLPTSWAVGLPEFVRSLEDLRDRQLTALEEVLLQIQQSPHGPDETNGLAVIQSWLAHLRADVERCLGELHLFLPWTRAEFRDDPAGREIHSRVLPEGRALPSLRRLESLLSSEVRRIDGAGGATVAPGLLEQMRAGADTLRFLLDDLRELTGEFDRWYREMDFSFLYDPARELFRIGLSVSEGEPDANHYDLLASEARIASAIAMSRGDAPPAHWLHLGRPFKWTSRGTVMLSWAGTMFEYLMPLLFMKHPPETVLEDACRRAVRIQRDHGRKHRIPWGISESGYHILSPEGDYQYRAFGVPLLGLRRSIPDRIVVSPYASLMAVSLAPGATARNLDWIGRLGGMGPWGPYEALDFGAGVKWREEPRVVRSYMSHHHGMLLAALGNHLTGNRLVERFHRDPGIQATEPWLFERIPWRRPVEREWVDRSIPIRTGGGGPGIRRWSPSLNRTPAPAHHLASGDLKVTIGCDGVGGSRWRDWAVIRGWVGTGAPSGGIRIVVLDRSTNESWSPLPGPDSSSSEEPRMLLEAHRAEFVRRSRGLRARMDVFLPPDGGSEVRQFLLSNESPNPRRLRLALSADVALAPVAADLRHPAFHKLFVRAEALPDGEGLLFERRSSDPEERPPVLLTAILDMDGRVPPLRWGTSRDVYLGRGGTPDRPAALDTPDLLASPTDPHHPLDPVAAAVMDVDLAPWEDISLTLLCVVGENRESVIEKAAALRSPARREWALIQARARAEGELFRMNAGVDDPMIWEELLAHVVHPRGLGKVDPTADLRQSSLWKWGISGDIPFILLEGADEGANGVLAQVVRAQRWWGRRGEEVDIVLVDRAAGEYQDELRDRALDHLARAGAEDLLGRRGGLHLVRGDDVGAGDWARLRALAAVRLRTDGPSIEQQLRDARSYGTVTPSHIATRATRTPAAREMVAPKSTVPAVDGSRPGDQARIDVCSEFGGFDTTTGEYRIELPPGRTTPAPWVNIVAREDVGFVVTESGGSFTWVGDAGEFRLTPWHNDPVRGLRGEAIYLRDEEDGRVWTPGPGPLGRLRTHRTLHGWGTTRLEASGDDLEERVTWHLHPTQPVKIVRVRIRNRGDRPRRLSATFFVDWVLGSHPLSSAGRLAVRFDPDHSAVLARNPFSLDFPGKVGFVASDRRADGMATDAEEFLGALGPFDRVPPGMRRTLPGERASPRGPGCGVIRREVLLGPGEEHEVSFFLGAAEGEEAVGPILADLRTPPAGPDLAEEENRKWAAYLDRVRVRTPDAALNRVMNGWLPYQAVSSRIRARTGFYQSGGAFGFRDQLQDAFALLPLDPALAKEQLVRAAQRQFPEGDVLHWWHPGTTRGVKTRCSDDLLWLPWVLARTVKWTGDTSLLDRRVPWLEGGPLPEDADERYDTFPVTEDEGSLWDHALRAVRRTSRSLSPRGLPLIGTMDWNDGMDRVGHEGRGESIWLGWFFIDVCRLLIPLARARSEVEVVRELEGWSATVLNAIEEHGWDGGWYRRAFFDDGTPLGSRDSPEARIDSIAQSWSVISGAADPDRARTALDAAWRELVRPDLGIALLLDPPFTGAGPNPGYIAAYPPGVRENGGQYTHAAAWLVRALARSGDGDRAGELLHMLLPNRRAPGTEEARRYRVEPYVMAADVYGSEPYVGRGGWTWYTGAAGWIWRVALEDVLGIDREGGTLRVAPCIPSEWDSFEVELQVDEARVEVRVRNPERISTGVASCRLDGREVDPAAIPLPTTGTASVEIVMGRAASMPTDPQRAVYPPSTRYDAPVRNEASSDET